MADRLFSKLSQGRISPNSDQEEPSRSKFYDRERSLSSSDEHSVSAGLMSMTMDSDKGFSPKRNNEKRPSVLESQIVAMLMKNQQLAQALVNVDDHDASDGSQSQDEELTSEDGKNGSISGDFVDVASEDTPEIDLAGREDSYMQIAAARVAAFGVEILDALSETNSDLEEEDESFLKPLNIKELKRNTKRCASESRPYLELLAGIQDILYWKAPLSTFTLFVVYMYCVWKGLLVSLLLFLVLVQLLFNYLSYKRNISVGISFLPRREVPSVNLDSPGAQLVLDISRLAQIILEYTSDVLEKVKNLFLWERQETTIRFLLLIVFWFVLSICVSMSAFFTIIGFGMGIKLFITTYLFYRFPRLRHKLDVVVWFLDRLPTNRKVKFQKNLLGKKYSVVNALQTFTEFGEMAAFCDSFEVPEMETPKIIRKCVMVDREMPFPYTVGSGSLYVTDSNMLFKYNRSSKTRKEIIKLPFTEILAVLKAKAIKTSLIQLGGKALEIFLPGRSKPYLLVGIPKRDECYENIITLGKIFGPKAQFAK